VLLFRGGAGILELRNGTTAQEFRVYGTTTGPKFTGVWHDGTNGAIYVVVGGGNLRFGAGDAFRWDVLALGHFTPASGNNYDLGDSTNTVRTGYFGTSLVCGDGSTTGWVMSATAATGLTAKANHRFAHGTSALATGATEGFLHIQSCAGAPTGTPASIPSGQIPMVYDSTNNRIYFYNGSWRSVAVA
jgi:hypothetical protein